MKFQFKYNKFLYQNAAQNFVWKMHILSFKHQRINECIRVTWGEINTLRPRQTGHHFADDIFKCIFLNENVWIPTTISLKFVPKGPINSIPALVQIMAWRRPGDKPLSEPMMVSFPTHICVARPQWVKRKSCPVVIAGFISMMVLPFHFGLSEISMMVNRKWLPHLDTRINTLVNCHSVFL